MALASTCVLLACFSDPVAPDPLGNWGGEGASVVVSAHLTDFEFDCAHGQVEAILVVDGQVGQVGWQGRGCLAPAKGAKGAHSSDS